MEINFRKPGFILPIFWKMSLITIILLGGSAALYLQTQNTLSSREIVNKLTIPVKSERLIKEIKTSGLVRPIQSVNLSPKTAGRLAHIYVEQGDTVKQGQVIARMEDEEIQGKVLQAQANISRTEARLSELVAGSRAEEIEQARARLMKAESRLAQLQAGNRYEEILQIKAQLEAAIAKEKLARQRTQRYQQLHLEGAISQDKLDEILTEQQSTQASRKETEQHLAQVAKGYRPEEIAGSQAEVKEAREAFKQIQKGSRPEEIAQAKAAVAEARAQLLTIKVQAKDTIIKAPFSGVISQRYADPGAFVTPTTSASSNASATSTSIVALTRGLEILSQISEVDINQIKIGQAVNIVADAYPQTVFKGIVRSIAPVATKDENVTSFQVKVNIQTGRDQLLPGMNVRLTFLGETLQNALVVPSVSILTQNGKTGVLVPDKNNEPQFHPVTIGSIMGDKIQIVQGVKEGDLIFINYPAKDN